MALPVGTILDSKFKIVQVLGEGGMGTVYKVEQVGTTPPYYYAVKELLISPNTSQEDRIAAIERFNKEIALLRGLKHPRIAALALPFQDRGNYYFAMEFVPGRSLEKILSDTNAPLPENQVIQWMMQVCEALSYIHTRTPPIILRDLKPGNIMVTPDNEVQLIDFGIARRFDPNKRTNTENLGTISYASPEHLGSITFPGQRRSAQNPGKLVQTDARSDIYSLGATMYHLLTNYEPDPIQTPAPGAILAKNPRLRTMQAGGKMVCPVEQVIIKAMQQDPAQRFQSTEAMRMALRQCLPSSVAPVTISIPAVSPNSTIVVPSTNAAQHQPVAPAAGLICPKCGFQNRPGAKFCKRDGQPLVQGATVAPPIYRPSAQQRPAPIRAQPIQRPIQPTPVQRSIQPTPSTTPAQRSIQPVRTNQPNPGTQGNRNPSNVHTAQAVQQRPAPIHARPVTPPPTTAAPNPANEAANAYRLGLQNLSNKNYPEAIKQFMHTRALRGPNYDVLYNLGRSYRQYGQSFKDNDQKQYNEQLKLAAEQFEAAVKLKTDALDAYFQLGMSYRDLGLSAQATGAFKKALTLAPQDPAIFYQLGMVAMEQGSNREAEAYFQDGLRINPDHALILIALGRLYLNARQTQKAIKTLREATQRDPALWESWYELGRAHMRAREWKLALSALEQARQTGIYPPSVTSSMAACYLKMNKKVEARQMVKETLQQDPQHAEALRLQKQL